MANPQPDRLDTYRELISQAFHRPVVVGTGLRQVTLPIEVTELDRDILKRELNQFGWTLVRIATDENYTYLGLVLLDPIEHSGSTYPTGYFRPNLTF